jgi:hypothetical protein
MACLSDLDGTYSSGGFPVEKLYFGVGRLSEKLQRGKGYMVMLQVHMI